MKAFRTSFGRTIPAATMAKVASLLAGDTDWQEVATDLLGPLLPDHPDVLDEVNEVLRAAECQCEQR